MYNLSDNCCDSTLGKFPYSVKGNSPNETEAILGFIPQMEITRESQLEKIDAGVRRLNISQHRLEILAKISPGSINDLRRGKRPMDAGKWQKICNIIGSPVANALPDGGERNQTESEIAFTFMMKMVFSLLVQHQVVSREGLDFNFTEAVNHYRQHHLYHAVELIEKFRTSVTSESRGLEKEVIRRLLELEPLGSA